MKNYNVFEGIGKDKKMLGYVIKVLVLLMFSSGFVFRFAFDCFKDFSDWEAVFLGICLIIYSIFCLIESFTGMIKIGNVINREERKKEENETK